MASAWRVISFFLVVFVLPTLLISLPLYARYHLYQVQDLPVTDTDTLALDRFISSFWCQGQQVTSNASLDAYLLQRSPNPSTELRQVNLGRSLIFAHDDIEYWGVYLLKGSSFSISAFSRWHGGRMMVVRGEDNLKKCFYRDNDFANQLNGVYEIKNHPGIETEEVLHREHPKGTIPTLEERIDEAGGGEIFDEQEYDDDEGSIPNGEIINRVELTTDSDIATMKEIDYTFMTTSKFSTEIITEASLETKYSITSKILKPEAYKKKDAMVLQVNKKLVSLNKAEGQSSFTSGNSNLQNLKRVRRTVLSVPHDSPNKATHSRAANTLDILHRFNATEVQWGNSSESSSEEFMEHCTDTILSIELSPYLNWQNRTADHQGAFHVNISQTDYYYFIFNSDNSIETNLIDFSLKIKRVVYDVSKAMQTCLNSSDCLFPLSFLQNEVVVVELPGVSPLKDLHSYEITTTCQPRVPVYMVCIFLVPLIILTFAFQ